MFAEFVRVEPQCFKVQVFSVGHVEDNVQHQLLGHQREGSGRILGENPENAFAGYQRPLGFSNQLRTEVRELLSLPVISQCLKRLRGQGFLPFIVADAAGTRHAQAHVERRADTGAENIHIQNPLAVGNRHDISRQVSRDVAVGSMDYRNAGQAFAGGVQPAGPLDEAGVRIKHVAAVGMGMAGEVIVNDDRVLIALLPEILSHRTGHVGGDVTHDERLKHR